MKRRRIHSGAGRETSPMCTCGLVAGEAVKEKYSLGTEGNDMCGGGFINVCKKPINLEVQLRFDSSTASAYRQQSALLRSVKSLVLEAPTVAASIVTRRRSD